jgi:hypothetical protein
MPHTITPLTVAEYQALVSGIPKYCPKAIFSFASQTYTAAQAVKIIATVLSAVSATANAKTALTDARQAEATTVAQNAPLVSFIRSNIAAQFNNNTTTLAAFDIQPKKPRQPLSPAARLAASAKAKATRAARGTGSKKQKATISGNVTGVSVTPITTPAPTPTAASAPTTPVSTAPAVGSTVTTSTSVATPAAPSTTAPAVSNGATPTPAGIAHA